MYYGSQFHMMGGEFKTSILPLQALPGMNLLINSDMHLKKLSFQEKMKTTKIQLNIKSLFEGKGDYSLAIDKNHYIWIAWNDGSVWRGRLNKLGFQATIIK